MWTIILDKGISLVMISLGVEHVGYQRLDFPTLKLSIVGGRPFSAGGQRLFRPKLLSKRLGKYIDFVFKWENS